MSVGDDEEENINIETKPLVPKPTDSNTINRLAIRHLSINFDKNNQNTIDEITENKDTPCNKEVVISAKRLNVHGCINENPIQENNFTFEDRKDTIPTPEKRLITKEDKPEQPHITTEAKETKFDRAADNMYSYRCNMFESVQSSENEDLDLERPRELSESLLNLNTYNGRVELYDNQECDSDQEECPQVMEDENYLMIRPAIEKKRLITIPKNNEYVNISDMLSRSFILDNSHDFKPSETMCQDGWNNLNLSLNFENQSPVKSRQNYSTTHLFKERQDEILRRMEEEHQRIMKARQRNPNSGF